MASRLIFFKQINGELGVPSRLGDRLVLEELFTLDLSQRLGDRVDRMNAHRCVKDWSALYH